MKFGTRRYKLGAFGVALLFAGMAHFAEAKTLAKVNGVEITDEDLRFLADDMSHLLPRQMPDKAREAYLLKLLIDREVVIEAARAQHFEERPEFAKRFAYLKGRALYEALIADVARNGATDAAIKAAYDEIAEKQSREIEFNLQQAVFATEDDAKGAFGRLSQGEDFAKIATESAKDGGPNVASDLGWLPKEAAAARFGEKALDLEPGRFSNPVKSQGKWVVVKLVEKRARPTPPLSSIRVQLQRYVEQKAQSEFIAKMREGAKVELEESATPPAADAAR